MSCSLESYDDPPPEESWPSAAAVGATGSSSFIPSVGHAHFGSDPPGDGMAPYGRGIGAGSLFPGRRRRVTLATAAVGAVGALVLLMVLVGRSGSTPASPSIAVSPAAFVSTSAQRTLAQQTAEFTFSGTLQGSGQTIPASGDGAINFTTNSMTLNIDVSYSSRSLVASEIVVGGNLYLRLAEDGRFLGRQWSQMSLVQSPADITNVAPFSELSPLAQHGASVKSLGTKNIVGESSTGYAVTPSRSGVIAWARPEIAKLGLSPAQASTELQYLQNNPPQTMTVWFDSHQLMREVSITVVSTSPDGSGPDGGSWSLTSRTTASRSTSPHQHRRTQSRSCEAGFSGDRAQ